MREAVPVRGAPQALRQGRDRRADARRPAREAREPSDSPAERLRYRVAAVGAALAAATALGQAHAATRPVRVLVVGDSVSAALGYQPSLETGIAKGFDVKFDLQVCRRLAVAGCPYAGHVPSSALDVVESAAHGSDVLVVDVGYNDDPALYGREMAQVIRAARAAGVREIVWVNLRETQSLFRRINAVIGTEAQRFPLVQVADWNSWSAGKPWFRSDGLHLTDSGAQGLALMLRVYIVSAARSAGATS